MRRISPRLVLPALILAGLAGCPDEAPAPAEAPGEAAVAPDEAPAPSEASDRPAIQRAEGAEEPNLAVVQWLDAVDSGDFEAAAGLAPPALSDRARRDLAGDLEEKLGGARRLDDVPFGMAPPQAGRTYASVTLAMPDGARRRYRLDLVREGGRWFAEPVELEAVEDTGEGIVPADKPGEAPDGGAAPDSEPAPTPADGSR